jgi:hypothetical protein
MPRIQQPEKRDSAPTAVLAPAEPPCGTISQAIPEPALPAPTPSLEALVDADLDTLATALYVRTDDLLKCCPERGLWRPVIGICPQISDAERVTLDASDEDARAGNVSWKSAMNGIEPPVPVSTGAMPSRPRRGRKARRRRPGRPAGRLVGSPVSTTVVVSRAPDGQQDQQHRPRHRGQSLVARGPAGAVSRRGWPGCPRCLDLLGWPRWLLVRAANPASFPGPCLWPWRAPCVGPDGARQSRGLAARGLVGCGCGAVGRGGSPRLLSSGAVASGRLRSPGGPPARQSRR